MAVVFFLTTFVLAYLVTHKPKTGGGVMDAVKEQTQEPPQQVPLSEQVPAQQAPEAGDPGSGVV